MNADLNKLADKIQHLLDKTVANGATEAEAKSALLMAQKLMAKYNIAEGDLSGTEEKITYSLEACKVKLNPRSKWMSGIIADSFGVRGIFFNNKIHFFGRSANAMAAKSALEFAHKVMERGMAKACQSHGLKSSQAGASLIYNAYAAGFLRGLKEALDAQTVALAVVVPEDVNQKFKERFPNTRTASINMRRGAYEADYQQGRTDGSQAMGRRSLEA